MRFWRKYIKNRGSALFMVISTMTALMISCMAMYFSVISSRSTQYAIFNQQQSKQLSMSIGDAIFSGLISGNSKFDKVLEAINKWDKPGEDKLVTDLADFIIDEDTELSLGSYIVEIKYLYDKPGGGKVIEIVVKSTVEGANDIYNIVFTAEAPSGGGGGGGGGGMPSNPFATTGYVPNDVFLERGLFVTDMFFDNEITYMPAYTANNGGITLEADLAVAGTLVFNDTGGIKTREDSVANHRDLLWAVRKDFINNTVHLDFSANNGARGTILVGNDLYLDNLKTAGGFMNADVYVLGDLHCNVGNFVNWNGNSRFFVNGNVYYYPETRDSSYLNNVKGSPGQPLDIVWFNGDFYYDYMHNINGYENILGYEHFGKDENDNPIPLYTITPSFPTMPDNPSVRATWDKVAGQNGVMTIKEVADLLEEKTASSVYYKWKIEEKYPVVDVLDFTFQPSYLFEYSESMKGITIKDTKYIKTWEHPEIVTDWSKVNNANNYTLVIDTGDDEKNVFTIQIKEGNRDLDGDGFKESFCWQPEDVPKDFNLIVKGRGTLIIDVADGVTYQDQSGNHTMHYGWFKIIGGTDNSSEKKGEDITYSNQTVAEYEMSKRVYKFLHTDCKAGDHCTYTTKPSEDICSTCGETMKLIMCGIHNRVGEYCSSCQPSKEGNYVGSCINHFDREAYDQYFAGLSAEEQEKLSDKKGIIYPTTNIYIVSSDESADIRVSKFVTGDNVIKNSLFGYIYAPYMTFKGYSTGETGGAATRVRLLGGFTVSDFQLYDGLTIMSCWPETLPTDLMSAENKKHPIQGANKSWKISLDGYR